MNPPPKHTEIAKAIKQLKKKAAGPDGIPAEVFMASPNMMATLLEPLIKARWELEHFTDKWKNGYIIKLPKKGRLKRLQELEKHNATEHHQQTGHHYFISAANCRAPATIEERTRWLQTP